LLGLLFELSADTNSSPRALELLNLYATSIGLEATSWQKLRSMGRDLAREHVWDAVIGLALGGLAVKSTAGGKAKKSKAFLEASLRNHPGIGSAVLSLRSPGDAIRSQQEILKQALESLGNIPFAANDDLTETGVLGLRWMFERALRSDLEILRRIRWFEMRGAVKFRRRAVAALEDLRV